MLDDDERKLVRRRAIRRGLIDCITVGIVLGYTLGQIIAGNQKECQAPIGTWLLVYSGVHFIHFVKHVMTAITYGTQQHITIKPKNRIDLIFCCFALNF
jgi:hypothetical protein